MSTRFKQLSLFVGFLLVLFAVSFLLPVASASSTFQNGQNASLVLGYMDFNGLPVSQQQYTFAPRAIAVDPVSRKVFISDMSRSRVLRFAKLADLSNGANPEAVLGQNNFSGESTGIAQNRLSLPEGLAVDSNGTLWVADGNNNRVLRFDNAANKSNGANADGVLGQPDFVTKSVATSATGMSSPQAVFVDTQGNLWVADSGNNRVLRFNNAASKPNGSAADGVLGQTNFTSKVAATTQYSLNYPTGITMDAQGTLWVSDFSNNRVLAFYNAVNKNNGANASVVLGQSNFGSSITGTNSTRFNGPSGLAIDPEGNLWLADANNNRVLGFHNVANRQNGSPADVVLGQPDFSTVAQGFSQNQIFVPIDVAIDPSGSLWIAEFGNLRALLFGYQSISFETPANGKVATTVPLNATASSDLPVTFQSLTPTICSVSGSNANLLAVGTCTIVAKQAGNGNSIPAAADVQRSFMVLNDAPITWDTPAPISYGTALSANEFNASSSLDGTFSYEPSLGTVLPAGTHTLTATFTPDSPLYLLTQKTVQITVSKAPLTVSAQNANRTYGAANPSFSVSYSGFVNNEDESVLDGSLSISSSADESSPVGSYPIVTSGLSSNNYEIDYLDGELSITKAPLIISVQNANRTYGAANPSFSVSYSGFVNDEDESVLDGSLSITTIATIDSPAGEYPISASGLSSENYAISYVEGILTILTGEPSSNFVIFFPFLNR